MSWRYAGDHGYIELVVLSNSGEHAIFPANHNHAEDRFEFTHPHESQAVKIHHSNESFKHGKVMCWESFIASTTGHEVAVRNVSPSLDNGGPFLLLLSTMLTIPKLLCRYSQPLLSTTMFHYMTALGLHTSTFFQADVSSYFSLKRPRCKYFRNLIYSNIQLL